MRHNETGDGDYYAGATDRGSGNGVGLFGLLDGGGFSSLAAGGLSGLGDGTVIGALWDGDGESREAPELAQ